MGYIKYSIAIVVVTAVLFHALVGGLFLYATHRQPSEATTCDMVREYDNVYFCMAAMDGEYQTISIVRSYER